MDALVIGGAVIAFVALAAVMWLRWHRTTGAKRRPHRAEPAPTRTSWTRSEVLSLVGIAVGASVGIAGLVLSGGDSPGPPTGDDLPNPVAYAALLEQGPFTEDLPDGLEARGLSEVNIGDSSAAGSLRAVQLDVGIERAVGVTAVFAHFEVYRTPKDALERAKARIALIRKIVGSEKLQGSASSYCSYETIRGPTSWECGGTSGLVYAEATVTRNRNVNQYVATETAAALLG